MTRADARADARIRVGEITEPSFADLALPCFLVNIDSKELRHSVSALESVFPAFSVSVDFNRFMFPGNRANSRSLAAAAHQG